MVINMNKENLLKEIEHVFGLEKGYYPYNRLPSTISYAIYTYGSNDIKDIICFVDLSDELDGTQGIIFSDEGIYFNDIILWSIDTLDWAHTPPEKISSFVVSMLDRGDIILMHDYTSHGNSACVALRRIIPKLLELGYDFVSVSELRGEK